MENKWVNMQEEEEAKKLLFEISRNRSPAVSRIDECARKLMEKHGYVVQYQRKGDLKWTLGVEEVENKHVKARRIVSTGRKPISDEKIAEIERMHLEGLSGREIARRLKIGEKTVRKYIGKFKKMESGREK